MPRRRYRTDVDTLNRQRHPDTYAAAAAAGAHLAAVGLDQALDDGEADAGAVARALAAPEALEKQGEISPGQGRAVVLEAEAEQVALAFGGDAEGAAGICP